MELLKFQSQIFSFTQLCYDFTEIGDKLTFQFIPSFGDFWR